MNTFGVSIRKLGAVLFWSGIAIGFFLGSLGVWASIEAVLFRSSISADTTLRTLSCPMIITKDEVGFVTATIQNPLDRQLDVAIRAYISEGFVTFSREEHQRVVVEPGERKQVQWQVTADDMVWRRLILVKVYQFGGNTLPSRQGSCGIIVIGSPVSSGSLLVGSLFGLSLILMLVGGYLWVAGNRELLNRKPDANRIIILLVASVSLVMVCGVMGWWLLGVLVVMLTILLLAQSFGMLAFDAS